MTVWARRFAIASGAALVAALVTTSLLEASAADCPEGEETARRGVAVDGRASNPAARDRAALPAASSMSEVQAAREGSSSGEGVATSTRITPARLGSGSGAGSDPDAAAAMPPSAPTGAAIPRPTAADCARDVEQPGCRFLDPDAEQLAELARCGQIRFEMPDFIMSREMSPEPDDAWLERADLSDEERAAFAEVGEVLREQLYGEMVELFVQAGRDRSWAEQTPFLGLVRALYELPDGEEDSVAAIARIARERAGLAPPPAADEALSIGERHVRATVGVADEFEALLGAKIGLERAAELRRLADGWDGFHTQTRSQCEDGT